jgi:hypothetical protein
MCDAQTLAGKAHDFLQETLEVLQERLAFSCDPFSSFWAYPATFMLLKNIGT